MKKPRYKFDILDSMVCGIIVTNEKLELEYMNQAAEELLGNSFSRLKGYQINDMINYPKLKEYIQHALSELQSQVIREDKFLIRIKGDEPVYVDCAITPVMNENFTGLLFEISQIDRQIRIARERQLIKTQAANQTVLRGIAHEIKNPLGGLRGAAQLLEIEANDDSVKEYTQIIISEADRLTKLVDNMLGSSQRPQKTWVNIHEALEHACQLIAVNSPKGIVFTRDYDPSIPEIEADRDQLVQIILNLLRNAQRAIGEHGQITLQTRIIRNFTIRKYNHPLVVCIKVMDTGSGIPEELQDKIFYPMITGHADGTGLGLSIAQSLINQHEGLIEFESKPGQTQFSILIPTGE